MNGILAFSVSVRLPPQKQAAVEHRVQERVFLQAKTGPRSENGRLGQTVSRWQGDKLSR